MEEGVGGGSVQAVRACGGRRAARWRQAPPTVWGGGQWGRGVTLEGNDAFSTD